MRGVTEAEMVVNGSCIRINTIRETQRRRRGSSNNEVFVSHECHVPLSVIVEKINVLYQSMTEGSIETSVGDFDDGIDLLNLPVQERNQHPRFDVIALQKPTENSCRPDTEPRHYLIEGLCRRIHDNARD